MTTFSSLFLILSALLSCTFSITSKNPVISVIFLILTFVLTAIYLIMKGIIFIGLSYIIIYVGAIAVIFLFVVMMINIRLTDILETESQYTKNLPLAILIGYFFLLILTTFFELNFYFFSKSQSLKDFSFTNLQSYFLSSLKENNLSNNNYLQDIWGNVSTNTLDDIIFLNNNMLETKIIYISQLENLGYNLYTYYAVLLIVLGFILLLSMFSAIIISNNKDNN